MFSPTALLHVFTNAFRTHGAAKLNQLDDELFKSIAAELHPNTSILWLKDIWQNNTNKIKSKILSECERSEYLNKENDDVSSMITPVNKESSSTLEPCCICNKGSLLSNTNSFAVRSDMVQTLSVGYNKIYGSQLRDDIANKRIHKACYHRLHSSGQRTTKYKLTAEAR
ncbi:unnamed protein product, partial [Didymodactylos carnosus]